MNKIKNKLIVKVKIVLKLFFSNNYIITPSEFLTSDSKYNVLSVAERRTVRPTSISREKTENAMLRIGFVSVCAFFSFTIAA